MPRTIVALYDGGRDGAARDTRIHRFAALPLEHLGYALVYADVAAGAPAAAPSEIAGGRPVAAVLSWFDAEAPDPEALAAWSAAIPEQCGARPRTVILGHPGMPAGTADDRLAQAGVAHDGGAVTLGVTATAVATGTVDMETEAAFVVAPGPYAQIRALPGARALAAVEKDALRIDLAVVGPAGGYAHDAALVAEDGRGAAFWRIDPFAFFADALAHGMRPVPDVTTRTGRRLFFATVDGSGWTDLLPSEQFGDAPAIAGEVVADRLVGAFPDLPVTVAVATGDLQGGAGRTMADRGRAAAAGLAAMPQVDLGSLGQSLVLRWSAFDPEAGAEAASDDAEAAAGGLVPTAVERFGRIIARPGIAPGQDRRHVDRPFALDAEIGGAAAEIAALSGAAAPTALLWSGDARPFPAALAAAGDAGLPAMGGEGGAILPFAPSLTALGPLTAPVGDAAQVLAALGDAPLHAAAATGAGLPGLARTLDWTEAPRRLKPFHLSYTARAALTFGDRMAVVGMMEAARGPAYAPVAARDYVAMVGGWRTARILREADLAWRVLERGAMQTVRFDDAADLALDAAASPGTLGALRKDGALYVALDPAAEAPLVALLRDDAPGGVARGLGEPTLVETGFDVSALSRDGCTLRVDVAGPGAGRLTWRAAPGAAIRATWSREGAVTSEETRVADADGAATLAVDALPGGLAELVLSTPCEGS